VKGILFHRYEKIVFWANGNKTAVPQVLSGEGTHKEIEET